MTDCFVATFYRFASLDDHVVLRDRIEARCQDLGIRGIILLATEGINATVSGTRDSVLELLDFLKSDPRLAELTWKESSSHGHPFRKLRVRLKKEIVTMGVPGVDPARLVGTYVAPKIGTRCWPIRTSSWWTPATTTKWKSGRSKTP